MRIGRFFQSLLLRGKQAKAPAGDAGAVATDSLSVAAVWESQPFRLIVVTSAILIIAIVAAAWMLLANLRSEQIAGGKRELASLAAVLAEQIDRGFQSIEVVDTAVIDRVQNFDIASSDDLRRLMSGRDTYERFRDLISGLPYIDAIVLTDADGKVVNFSRSWPVPPIQRLVGGPADVFKKSNLSSFIGKPLRSPATGSWVVPVARKIVDSNNKLLGTVIGVMRLRYFEQLFKSIARSDDRSISIFSGDATLIARYPVDEALRGKSFAHRALFKKVLSKSSHGTIQQTSIYSGKDLLISGRKLPHFPLSVVVTKKVDDVLAGWWYAALYVAGAAIVIASMIGAAASLVARQIGKRLQAQNRRLDAALNNISQGLAMFDAAGHLIVYNERYLEMYNMPPGKVRLGCTLQDLLRFRVANGTFPKNNIDPDQYVVNLSADILKGKSTSFVFALDDGRMVSVTNQPMPGGGWVSSHDDITPVRRREASFRLLFESNPLPMWVYDTNSLRLLAVNDAGIARYGYSREQFLSMTTVDIHPAEDREPFERFLRSGVHDGKQNWRHQKANGNIIDVEIYARTLNYDGRAARLVLANDVTDRQRAEEQLRRAEKFLDSIIENIPAPIMVKDVPHSTEDATNCRYTLVNRACEDLFGVSRVDIVGKTAYELYPEERAEFIIAENSEALRSHQPVVVPDHAVHTINNGVRIATARTFAVRDDDDKPQYLLTILEDVTERKRTEQGIARMAHYDDLTDLPNRTTFNDALNAALERAGKGGERFAVLSLDLDGFKEANDTYGHSVGDVLLCEVARRLQRAAGSAFVARLGGDEFALIVTEGEQPAAAAVVAKRLLAAFEDEAVVEDRQITIGVTIGGAIYPADGADSKTLMINADIALYRAKAEARGKALFFDAEMGNEVRERRALQDDLRSAVARGEMLLHYQPQKKMTGDTIGFEALARWQCPKRGMVPPGVFIPVAEESGTIIAIGDWVLHEACREAASWPEPLTVAVNVSPIQFRAGDLPGFVHAVLLETGLAPCRLELEITEGVLIEDFSRALSVLCRLKALGVRIALDDFGTGYSSLSYLHAFSFDKIKIDRAFISDLERNQHSQAIVRAVIDLGHSLQVPTLAEGVETVEQHAMLVQIGCDEVQGYLTGRPCPIADYAELVGRGVTARPRQALAS